MPNASPDFAAIAKLQGNSDELKWVWAIANQLELFHRHDARWIKDAQAGRWSDASFKQMLSAYSLLRGKRGQLLAGENSAARSELQGIALSRARNWPAEVGFQTEAWFGAGHELAKIFNEELAEGQWFMPSATLKVLWFHRPRELPMYDSRAASGLARVIDGKRAPVKPEAFLEKFSKFFARTEGFRRSATGLWGVAYPYDMRMTDKYLWLIGGDDSAAILQNFQESCRQLAAH